MWIGLASKALASFSTYPLVVAKVRMQTMGRAKPTRDQLEATQGRDGETRMDPARDAAAAVAGGDGGGGGDGGVNGGIGSGGDPHQGFKANGHSRMGQANGDGPLASEAVDKRSVDGRSVSVEAAAMGVARRPPVVPRRDAGADGGGGEGEGSGGGRARKPGLLEILIHIVTKEGGPMALYRGVAPSLCKAAVTEAILSVVRDKISYLLFMLWSFAQARQRAMGRNRWAAKDGHMNTERWVGKVP